MGDELLPLNWKKVALKDTTEIIMGQSPPSETYNIEGKGYPFLQGKADFSERYPKPTKWCTKPLKVAEGGSILISVRAPVGDVNLADQNYIIGRGLCSIRFNKNYDNEFLFYCLMYNKKRIESQGSGTTFQSINKATLDNFTILFPPLPEQRAIARALRAVQAAREARLREITLERERKAALMEHLFTHGTRGEPTKMTEIGEMPEGWKTPKLADLAEIQSGGTPLRNHHEYYNGSINWAKTLDLNDGIVRSTEEKITDLGFHSIRGKIRPIDTVMVAMYGGSGTVGKSGILGIPAATNQAVCCIEPNFERFDSLYLLYYLIHFRPNWMRYAIGTRKDPNISKGIIESLKIPLPPLGQQKEISRTIKACDTKITALGQEACLLDELFRAMLEELMTGRQRAGALVSDKS